MGGIAVDGNDRLNFVVTSVTEDGQSIATERDVSWERLPNLPVSRRQLSDLSSSEPRWHLSRLDPGADVPLHATDSIDYICLVSGQLELVLPSRTIRMAPGDCVMQRGAEHGWRVIGDEPAIINAVLVPLSAQTGEGAQ